MTHRFPVRVYYEDTDLAGIVYYANYLRFIERARSEMIEAAGIDQGALFARAGLAFAVRRIEADYLAPARYGDRLQVLSTITGVGGARVSLEQVVERAGQRLFSARVVLACLAADGRPARLPGAAREILTEIRQNDGATRNLDGARLSKPLE